ncbi:MAG: hypothetical protein HW390_3218 [Candidatus Brocadiaceae bacterium]|nr:hypothetical protein [Candidatus Brocadiaceae bacterium]
MTKRERITFKAKDILADNPEGIRFSKLVNRLWEAFPSEAEGNITGSIWNLDTRFPDEIYKPSRGLFRLLKFKKEGESLPPLEQLPKETDKICEESFYQAFADWLIRDLEECTVAIPLGGNKFKEKWGTPDIFGIFKGRESDIIKSSMEIVVAEVKMDTNQLITAFGQACAYKLFAHKSYLVIPIDSQLEDIDRLDSLCIIFGVGLILFDATNPVSPAFQIRARATKHEPDSFYANRYLKLIADDLHL